MMRILMHVLLALAAGVSIGGCGGPTEGEPDKGNPGRPAGTPERSTPESDPEPEAVENPWLLGYRFRGTPGTKFNVKRTTTGSLGVGKDGSNHVVGDEPVTIVLNRVFRGVRLEARIESRGDGVLEMELVEARPKDPEVFGGEVEVRKVIESGSASGFKGTLTLSGGEAVPE